MLDCIVVMAKTLGCQTIAEGVETREDVHRMTSLGIDEVQGYFYSGSIAAASLPKWIHRYRQQGGLIHSDARHGERHAVA